MRAIADMDSRRGAGALEALSAGHDTQGAGLLPATPPGKRLRAVGVVAVPTGFLTRFPGRIRVLQ